MSEPADTTPVIIRYFSLTAFNSGADLVEGGVSKTQHL